MPRPPRIRAEDVVYHVTARGIRRLRIYEDDLDYRKFEFLLAAVVVERDWAAHAYCEMPNHYHLVITTPKPDISEGMCWLNGVYARWFNERHGYSGHVFEARFHTEIVKSNVHLMNVASYVPLNPVRARLCHHPADWPWSSYRATAGKESKSWLSPWLVEQFGRSEAQAARAYESYVESRMAA